MAYKKFIKKGGKTFGPYYYESYRDQSGKVRRRYLGTVDPKAIEKKVVPTKILFFKRLFLIPILLFVFFGLLSFSGTDFGNVSEPFEKFSEVFSGLYGSLTGLAVDEPDVPIPEQPIMESSLDEEPPAEVSAEEGLPIESSPAEEVVIEETPVSEIVVLNESVGEEVVNESVEEVVNESVEEVVNESVEEVVNESVEGIANETLLNETVLNETLENETILNETILNETVLEELLVNETILNETLENETVLNISVENISAVSTLQYKAVAGRPVKWLKKVDVGEDKKISVEIPSGSTNVSVLTNEEVDEAEREIEEYNNLVGEADREDVVGGSLITGNVALDIRSRQGLLSRFWHWITSFSISGNVVLENELEADGKIIEFENVTIVDLEEVVSETNIVKVGVGYYTPAPVINESVIARGKRIVVSADDIYNYTDVLAYSLIDELIEVNSSKLKLYWMADYEDAVRYGAIVPDEPIVEINEPIVEENETIVEENVTVELNESVIEENETQIEEPVVNETEVEDIIQNESVVEPINDSLIDSGKDKKDKKEKKEKENNSDNSHGKKVGLLTGNVVEELNDSEIVERANENISESIVEKYYRIEVDYVAHDFDKDGFVDYVEWIVPHLSNQTYELIIEISGAEHLDSNRTFIKDIYNETSVLDDNWVVINDSEYVRVSFEQVLDRSRDITIYARANESANVSVYLEDGNSTIAVFENISEAKYYKIYLSNLSEGEKYETFDLRMSGAVEFDYIVDPDLVLNMSRKHNITINEAYVDENLVDFPMLITNENLANEVWNSSSAYHARSDGCDIRFSMYENGTGELPLEVVNFSLDSATGSEIWVKVNLSGSVNTTIWIWYNDADASCYTTSETYGAEAVWKDTYEGVWHLHNDFLDSTNNNNDGTNTGSTDAVGKLGDSQSFDGNDYINVGNITALHGNPITVSAWINTSVSGDRAIAMKSDGGLGQESFYFWLYGGRIQFLVFKEDSSFSSATSSLYVNNGQWQYVSGTWDGTTIKTYINGSQNGTGSLSGSLHASTENIFAGAMRSLGATYYPFIGKIDELRASRTAHSSGWVDTEFHNQNSPSTFAIEGISEFTKVGMTFVSPTPANGANLTRNYVEVNVSIDDPNGLTNFTWNWNGINYTSPPYNLSGNNISNCSILNYSDPSLLLAYNFDNISALGENNTRVVDLSGRGNNGTPYVNAAPTANGKYGGAFSFATTETAGCSVRVANEANFDFTKNDNFTISAWIKTTNSTLGHYIITKSGLPGWGLTTYGTALYAYFYGTFGSNNYTYLDVTDSPNFYDGNWHHVVAVASNIATCNVNSRIYFDGVDRTSCSGGNFAAGNDILNDVQVYVANTIGQTANWDGSIDEVRIWNRSLSASEISQLYYANLKKYSTSNWAFYSNQTSLSDGTYLYQAFAVDTSGNANSTEQRSVTIDGTAPGIGFVSPTPPNGSSIFGSYAGINVSLTNANDMANFTYNWGGANYSYSMDLLNNKLRVNFTESSLNSLSFSNGTSSVNLYNDSLVLMYNFDNVSALGECTVAGGAGCIKDASISRWNATLWTSTASPTWITGKYGGAFSFDGSNDGIDVNFFNKLNGATSLTVSLWTYRASYPFSKSEVLVGFGGDAQRMPAITGTTGQSVMYLRFETTSAVGDCTVATPTLTEGTWQHLTFTWNGSVCKSYLNGIYGNQDTTTGNTLVNLTDGYTFLGVESGGGAYYTGYLDEVRIWNRSLSDSEIALLYESNLNKYDTNKWSVYNNQSNLTELNINNSGAHRFTREGTNYSFFSNQSVSPGQTYTTRAFASDSVGNQNSTDLRTFFTYNSVNISMIFGANPIAPTGAENLTGQMFYSNGSAYANGSYNVYYDGVRRLCATGDVDNGDGSCNATYTIASGNDDTYAAVWSGITDANILSASEVELGAGWTAYTPYLRWQMGVPKNSQIINSYIQVKASQSDGSAPTPGVKLLDTANQQDFSNYPNGSALNNIPVSGNVGWSLASWAAGNLYNTSNISSLVQTYVGKAEYSPGNYIGLKIQYACCGEWYKFFYSYNSGNTPAKLMVRYIPTQITNSTGGYNFTSFPTLTAGRHNVTVNLTTSYNGNYTNSSNLSVYIPFSSSVANSTRNNLNFVTFNESVWINTTILSTYIGTPQLSSVWANLTKPSGTSVNVSLAGNVAGGVWYLNYTNNTEIGNYSVKFYANLTDGFSLITNSSVYYLVENATMNVTYPLNNSLFNYSGMINFTYQIVDSSRTFYNCSLFVNGAYLNSTATIINGTNYFNQSFSEGAYNYSITCNATNPALTRSSGVYGFAQDASALGIRFVSPTPTSGARESFVPINVSMTNASYSDMDKFVWNWNGTNYTLYNDSLVLMYNFDNVSALGECTTQGGLCVKDLSGYGNNGTLGNVTSGTMPTWNASGKYGGAFVFDGGDFVDAKNSSSLNFGTSTDFSISVWIKGRSFDNTRGILQKYNTISPYDVFSLRMSGSSPQLLLIDLNDGDNIISASSISVGEWYHIVGVFDRDVNLKIYVNGILNGTISQTTTGINLNNVEPIKIGYNAYQDSYFNGTIDEVRIWNRSLNSTEITQLYRSNLKKYDTDKWLFYADESDSADGTYTYQAYVADGFSNWNSTEQRSVTIDSDASDIDFVSPTLNNSAFTPNSYVVANVSMTDAQYLEEFVWNWNGTNYTSPSYSLSDNSINNCSVLNYNDSSLVLAFNFDNISSLGECTIQNGSCIRDLSGKGNNGTLGNSTMGTMPNWNASGKYGGAFVFDGINDWVNVNNSVSIENITESDYTWSAWYYPNEIPEAIQYHDSHAVLCKAGWHTAIRYYSDSKFVFTIYNSSNNVTSLSSSALSPQNWYHLVGAVNNSAKTVRFYVNGSLIGSTSYIGSLRDYGTSPLKIGTCNTPGADNDWVANGTIDEVRIWNRSLSSSEISQLYSANLNKYDSDKWLFWTNRSGLGDGGYTYNAYVKDSSDNWNSTGSRGVAVDTTYPTIYFESDTTTEGVYDNYYILANVSASDLNWERLIINLYNSTGLYQTNLTSSNNLVVNFSSLPVGHYYLNATANDSAGNRNSTSTRHIEIVALSVFDAYDLENDSEDLAGWFSAEGTGEPAQQEYFFANYSFGGSSITGASCNLSIFGNGINETQSMNYNSSVGLYYYNRTFGYSGNYSWNMSCVKTAYALRSESGEERVRIILQNASSLGAVTEKITVNDYENVTLSVDVSSSFINSSSSDYVVDSVWAEVVKPDFNRENVSLSGSATGGVWAETFENTSVLGTHIVTYYANLTNNFNTINLSVSNFSVENTSISINTVSEANTTDVINIEGLIERLNGTNSWALANNLFTIKLNNVTVSSDILNHTNFTGGTGTHLNITNVVRLNLTSEGTRLTYDDDYTTNAYTTEAYNYSNVAYNPVQGTIFELDNMLQRVGNVTYKFTSVTKFYNATAYVRTLNETVDWGGNTSIWYSFNNINYTSISWSMLPNASIGGTIPVNGKTEFYVMVMSDIGVSYKENPVTSIEVNHSSYDYANIGDLISPTIQLPNVTYTILRWDESSLGGTDIKIQLRESDDGIDWDAWGANYTSGLNNDISFFTKDYLQYRAWLSTTNGSVTPILVDVRILYFNASTNSSGGYDYNITIPTDSLGVLPLEVLVSENSVTGIVGTNTTNITVWAETEAPYSAVFNYSGNETKYTINVNFTRADTGALVDGFIRLRFTNMTGSSWTRNNVTTNGQASRSWNIPSELRYGNYTVNISAWNESAYYRNASASYMVWLEQKNTTGTIYSLNKTISDYSYGSEYYFEHNVVINNTGNASMFNPRVYDVVAARGTAIKDVVEIIPCGRIYPNQSCNATLLVSIKDVASPGTYGISLRANWTDNDGGVAGGAGYISYPNMKVIIVGNSVLNVSVNSTSLTVQHGRSGNFSFYANSTGSDTVWTVNTSLIQGALLPGDYALPNSWFSVTSTNPITNIPAGSSSRIDINITVPLQTVPGNYSGKINVSAAVGGNKTVNLTVVVPVNGSWYLIPSSDFTYNNSYSLNTPAAFANYTLVNLGNINMTFDVSYSPNGTIYYDIFGTELFEENYVVSGNVTNPTSLNVTKGGNSTITLYQKGRNSPLENVGIIITFQNTSASPTSFVVGDAWTIEEQPPVITGLWFLLNGISGTIAEQNKNLTIKFRATDDVALNVSGATFNISWSGWNTQTNAMGMEIFGEYQLDGSNYIILNYSGNYSPTTSGDYGVIATVLDTSGKSYTSGQYNFTSYGTTNVGLSQNYSSITVNSVDLNNAAAIYINYTINNTGLVTAYSPTLSFEADSKIETTSYLFGDLSSGSISSGVVRINVTKLTPAGVYNVTTTLTWTNPNTGTDTEQVVFSITVGENRSISHSPQTVSSSVSSGGSNSTFLQINNTGNTVLSSMNLDCYTGSLCSIMSVSFNESDFSIGLNSSKLINISLSAPAGLAAGNYFGTLNVSANNYSHTIDIQANVPETKTWGLSPTYINISRGVDSSGSLQVVVINNTGNTNMTWDITSSNSSIFSSNVSSLTVPLGESREFMINYTVPSSEGSYRENISVVNTNGGASPVRLNVSIDLLATRLSVDILSPSNTSVVSNVQVGDEVSIIANATYGDDVVNDSSLWTVLIGGESCSNESYVYDSNSVQWNISCLAPDITNGEVYNITVTLVHDIYGEMTSTNLDAVSYLDTAPPQFNFTRNNINSGSNINIIVNVSDNVAVDNAWGILFYPNMSNRSFGLTYSGGFYINNSFVLNVPGEYLVNITANDTAGNVNSTLDWFEVYDRYNWLLNLTDYSRTPISGVNVSLYRPYTSTLLMSNVTNSSGILRLYVNRRFYDMNANFSGNHMKAINVNYSNWTQSNISFNGHSLDGDDVNEVVTLYKPFVGIVTNSSGMDSNVVNLSFNYSGYSYDIGTALGIVKCDSWNYGNRSCVGSWSSVPSVRNIDSRIVFGSSTGVSAYFLAENHCGNGACEVTYGETTTTCSDDCKETSNGTTTTTIINSGGGGGGGGSGLSSQDLADIKKIINSFLDIGGINLEVSSIYKEVFPGDTATVRVRFRNVLDTSATLTLEAKGDVAPLIFFESGLINFEPRETKDVIIKIVVPKFAKLGEYDGQIAVSSGGEKGTIPTTINVLSPEGKLLDVKIQPLSPTVAPGEILKLQTDLLNLGKTERVDVQFDLQLIEISSGEIIARNEEAFAVEVSTSTIKNITVPEYAIPGRYMIKATASYSNIELDGEMQATSIAYVQVQYSFFKRKLFGIYMWMYFILMLLIASGVGTYYYWRYLEYKKRRFKTKIDVTKLPRASSHSEFIGKIAETGIRTFVDLNKMQTHTLIAGATGSGKTVAAQGMIEAALKKNKSVIVFDPTAQWTGFLRKCADPSMLRRYKYFNMKASDAKAFEGSVKTIHDPYEIIDIKKYMNRPGEITIFNVSHLTPKEMDIVVASTIEQIFKSEPEESADLNTLIVYDEVHRLLPKFGGSGQGFVQLERGAREFRKWGIGLVLISQVLSDFIGEIKANIGTELQMRTRYEGDLERVGMKYGEDILKSVVKEPIGTGMVVNAEYNNGIPYFVSYRPLLHSTKRLSNDELAKYEKYFDEIDDIDYQVAELKKLNVDVMDLELELKLSKSKVKSGQFQMADMYLETLRPKVAETWKKLGKNPIHIVKKKISLTEVSEGIKKAASERAKYIKKNPHKVISFDENIISLKKKIEEHKRKGRNTSSVEVKLKSLEERLKPFKGKISSRDATGLSSEIDALTKEIDSIGGATGAVKK